MKKKSAFLVALITFLIAVIATMPIYSWFVIYHTKLLVVVSDISMEVTGWYEVAATDFEGTLRYATPLTEVEALSNLFLEHYIAFKFNVLNKSGQNAKLSVRFCDFSENIFRHFREYYAVVSAGGTVLETSELGINIIRASLENTAKTTLMLTDVYYEDPMALDEYGKPSRVNIMGGTMYLWQYLTGQKFIEGVDLPNARGGSKVVSLYFKLINIQSQDSLTEYRKWLCDKYMSTDTDGNPIEVPGYGRERCANLLGYTWENTGAADKAIIDAYLRMFYNYEISAINLSDEELSNLSLNIKYFEFIGETTPI